MNHSDPTPTPASGPIHQDRGHLLTERPNERSRSIDTMSIPDAFDVISAEDATVASAVARAKDGICSAVRLVTRAFQHGGRLIYVGAGTSGRLGVLDAAECPPTFLTDPTMVQGIIAGGWDALRRSIENAEDDPQAGAAAIEDQNVDRRDVVLGITTGGTTPFVRGALQQARRQGAKTVFVACVPAEQAPMDADVSIRILTGPEVITGSTRMKAGSATKMALNMITTLSMVAVGKVYGNLMVDLNAGACAKLGDRAVRVLQQVTGLQRGPAQSLLDQAAGHVKTAIIMHRFNLNPDTARRRLESHGGRIPAIDPGAE